MPKKAVARRDGIYERPDAKGYWGSWTDAKGRRQRRRFDAPTLDQARRMLDAEKQKVEEHKKTGKPVPTEASFAEFAEEFLGFQESRISLRGVVKGRLSEAEYERQRSIIALHLNEHFGEMKLASVRKSDVIAYINKRTKAGASDGTIIKEVNTLKRLFNVAIDLDRVGANPAQRAKLPQAPQGRTRYLSNEEWHEVFHACPEWLRPIVGLSVTLGTRRGELLAVRWEDVNMKAGTVALTKTKNGRPRFAHFNDLALQVLTTMTAVPHKRSELLFPGVTPMQVSVAFRRACKAAGVEDFSLHDLRHTFASHQRMAGTDIHELMTMMGHSDVRQTVRYSHLDASHLAKAAHRLDGVITLPAIAPERKRLKG